MGMWKTHYQKPHEIEVRHYQFLGLESEQLILHELSSDQDRSLPVIGVPTWVVHLYCLAIFQPRH